MNQRPPLLLKADDDTIDADRRTGERYRSVWRIAKVIRDGDMGLWRVCNISERGMKMAAKVPMTVGERLHIGLSETVGMYGKIIWASGGHCGVAFDQAIQVGDVLKTLAAEQRASGYRQPRLPFDREALIIVGGKTSTIILVNLSQSGAGFEHDGPLEIGKPLGLLIAGKIRRTAIVRWMHGRQGGLWLTEPLGQSDLESIRQWADKR